MKKPLQKGLRTAPQWLPSFVIFIVMFILAALMQDNLLTQRGITNLINSYFPLLLMAIGQTAVMISGCIDLSNGTALSLMTCILAATMKANDPATGGIALLLAFAAMLVTALLNGFIVGIMRVPPVIATFATSYIYMGAALFILPRPGGACVNWFNVFYRFSSVKGMPDWIKTVGSYVPPIAISTILVLILWLILKKTEFGRYLYATGSNEESAYFSGVNTSKVRMQAYLFNAFCILVAAMFFVAQNQSADYQFGNSYSLKSIASAVIGGVAMSGGRGDMMGAVMGALIINLVNKIIFFSGLPTAYQTMVNGAIVIVALVISYAYTLINRRIKEKKG